MFQTDLKCFSVLLFQTVVVERMLELRRGSKKADCVVTGGGILRTVLLEIELNLSDPVEDIIINLGLYFRLNAS